MQRILKIFSGIVRKRKLLRGYTPYFSIWSQERSLISVEERDGLTPKSEKYLRKIIAYAKEKESKLVLIVTPYIVTAEDKKTYNQIADIAEEEKIIFIDFNEYYDAMKLDFNADFNDLSHLNYWGSCKFTDFLGLYLSQSGWGRIEGARKGIAHGKKMCSSYMMRCKTTKTVLRKSRKILPVSVYFAMIVKVFKEWVSDVKRWLNFE